MPSTAVVRHFEDAAAGYTAFRNAWPLNILRRQERTAIAALMAVQPGDLVLDAGCGDGELLRWLIQQGARPIGIDIARKMTAQCRRLGFPVAVQDLERPAFRAAFDWVLCFGAMEFADDPARAYAALAGVLRPGGRLALLFPKQSVLGQLYAFYHRRSNGVRVHLFHRAQVARWMQESGMTHGQEWRELSLSMLCVAQRA